MLVPIPSENTGPLPCQGIKVQIELRICPATRNAELEALGTFFDTARENINPDTDAGKIQLFNYFVLLHEPTQWFNLEEAFPYMFDLTKIEDEQCRDFAKEIIEGMDFHQLIAYHSLKKIPHHMCFVPGGPGSGKTRWALNLATLAQFGPKKVRILFMLDLNKPVDDVAKRMAEIYGRIPGNDKKVIRMHGWVKESSVNNPLFAPSFIQELKRMSSGTDTPPVSGGVLSLDEAAWQLLQQCPEDFPEVTELVDIVKEAWRQNDLSSIDKLKLSRAISPLYSRTLQEADFIATTPVAAAHWYFACHFDADIVFYDEAAHARELSTLIPIAFFDAKAYFFIGDHKQVMPYVGNEHKYAHQLQIPTLLRATKSQKSHDQLLTNHRAYGELHELSSALFYDGKMVAAQEGERLFPEPVKRVREYLDTIRGHPAPIPRILIAPDHYQSWKQEKRSKSPSNKVHRNWIVPRVLELLNAPWFTRLDGETPGTIMIVASLRGAVKQYRKRLGDLPVELRSRVNIRTIDGSQGHEADIVFIDIVKMTAFHDDGCRLCVATTRAIQGEIILMARATHQSDLSKFGNISNLIDHCDLRNQSHEDVQHTRRTKRNDDDASKAS